MFTASRVQYGTGKLRKKITMPIIHTGCAHAKNILPVSIPSKATGLSDAMPCFSHGDIKSSSSPL